MIHDSDIEIKPATCCATNARLEEIRLDAQYEATALRAGNNEILKYDYTFYCTHCFVTSVGYVVCNRADWIPLAEFIYPVSGKILTRPLEVPAANMLAAFAQLKL